MNNFLIYGLVDPETKEIRYIGRTGNLSQRIWNHRYYGSKTQKGCQNHCLNWIYSLFVKGLEFEVTIIEGQLTEEESIIRETYWIKFYKEKFDLCNHNEGGYNVPHFWEGKTHDKSAREKISISKKGRLQRCRIVRRIPGNPNGRSHRKGIAVTVLDADTKEILYKFSNLRECGRVLNLNPWIVKVKALNQRPYTNFMFELETK